MNKKTLILLPTLSLLLPLVSCQSKIQFSGLGKLGIWYWSSKDNDEITSRLSFAKENNITEIYFSDPELGSKSQFITEKAKEDNLDVYYLLGDVGYMINQNTAFKKVERFIQFNKDNIAHPYKGIHFDVEPHQSDDFKSNRKERITQLIDLAYTLKTKYPTILFDYDIPFWLDDEISYNNENKPAYQFMVDYAYRSFVMSYRDSADKMLSVSKEETEYAKSTNKDLFICCETSYQKDEPQISFYEEGKKYMFEQLKTVRESIPENFGISIHHMNSFYSLKD